MVSKGKKSILWDGFIYVGGVFYKLSWYFYVIEHVVKYLQVTTSGFHGGNIRLFFL